MIFLYEEIPGGIRILRVFGEDDRVTIPENIEGKPVTELGAYAFSDHIDEGELKKALAKGKLCAELPHPVSGGFPRATAGEPIKIDIDDLPKPISGALLWEARLPVSLRRIGRYAFYNCRKLHRVTFSGTLSDVGAGAFTGCHQIQELCVKLRSDGSSCLRDILTELPETIRVDLHTEEGLGCFWFPEFFEEGVENTPARILENHVHGSGLRYRNCFQHLKLNVREYDGLFPYARAWEDTEVVTSMAMGRVLHPMELSDGAKEQYESYLKDQLPTAACILEQQHDYRALGQLLRELKPDRSQVEELLENAQRMRDMEAVSLLMDHLHSHTKTKRRSFEL